MKQIVFPLRPMVALRASGAAVYLEREEKNIDADDVTNHSIARSRIKGCNLSEAAIIIQSKSSC